MDIAGKGVVITGASEGLGAALGHRLASAGAKVVLFARRAAPLEAVVEEIRRAGGQAWAVTGDIADKDAIYPLAATASELTGGVEVLVHNASTLGPTPLRLLLDSECEDLERVLRPVWREGDRLLVRTDYLRNNWGRPDYWDVPPYLTPSAAEWAIDNGASLFGLDCLTERPGDAESPVHHALLAAGIPLLEYVTNMHELTKQVVQLFALPIKAAGAEAAPARVIAMENNHD